MLISTPLFQREQIDRESALSDFTSGAVRVLIATDVASRGLDVKVRPALTREMSDL